MLTICLCNYAWFKNHSIDVPAYNWGASLDAWEALKALERFGAEIYICGATAPIWVRKELFRYGCFGEICVAPLPNGTTIRYKLKNCIERLQPVKKDADMP